MACHVPIPREVPSAWSWGCLQCPRQLSCSWLGWWDRRGCQALPCWPPREHLWPPGSPQPAWPSKSNFLLYFVISFPNVHLIYHLTKVFQMLFSKLNNWRGLIADSDTVSKLSGCILIGLFNYDVCCSDYSSPLEFHVRMTLAVLFHLGQSYSLGQNVC